MSDTTLDTLIADDEPLARDLLRHLLGKHCDVRIVAECADGEATLAALARHTPHVAFLDIQMPRLDGLKLLQQLPPAARPAIVFVTAHEAYAVQAFAAQAFDYLLKPFDAERLDATLARLRQHHAQLAAARLGESVRQLLHNPISPPTPPKPAFADRIVIRESGRVSFVEVAAVEWLSAEGNYVALHVAGGKTHLVHETMHALEGSLDPTRFLRIHRSTIVRVDRIKELQPHFNGEFIVILRDDTRLKLSRSYADHARTALGLERSK